MSQPSLETLVARAVAGDANAMDAVVLAIKDDIYGLAIRMLWHPADAEDATQEILLRVVTRMGSFEGRARFRTWVYRVAVRALLNARRSCAEKHAMSFDDFGRDLLDGLDADADASRDAAERALLRREVKLACTQAMLMCLDRDHRIAYLLGEIFELSGAEAADCVDVPPATYRKRLSRARKRVHEFMAAHCSLVDGAAPCSCDRRIAPAVRAGRVDPDALLFAEHPVTGVDRAEAEAVVGAISQMCDGGAVMRSNPSYRAPARVTRGLRVLTGT